MYSKRGRKAQLTLFIIIAVVVVAVVILAIILVPKITGPKKTTSESLDPAVYISSCVSDPLEEPIKTLSQTGGFSDNENCIYYNNACRHYLCYQEQFFMACVNQEPMLKEHIEQELKTELQKTNTVKKCVDNFAESARRKGYEVAVCDNPQFSVNLTLGQITVPINCQITIVKDETKKYEKIIPSINSRLYDFILTSQEIILQEINNKDFDPLGYMLRNYWVEVNVFRTSSGSKIFTLTERENPENQFVFAVRNYVTPPGIS